MPKYKSKRDQLYVKTFYHPVWRLNVWVVMCKDRSRIRDFVAINHDGDKGDITAPSGVASMYLVKNSNAISGMLSIIALPMDFDLKNKTHNMALAHESIHCAIALHRMHGIYLPVCGHSPLISDDEGLCYTVDWIMDNCYEMIENKNNYKFKFSDEFIVK